MFSTPHPLFQRLIYSPRTLSQNPPSICWRSPAPLHVDQGCGSKHHLSWDCPDSTKVDKKKLGKKTSAASSAAGVDGLEESEEIPGGKGKGVVAEGPRGGDGGKENKSVSDGDPAAGSNGAGGENGKAKRGNSGGASHGRGERRTCTGVVDCAAFPSR